MIPRTGSGRWRWIAAFGLFVASGSACASLLGIEDGSAPGDGGGAGDGAPGDGGDAGAEFDGGTWPTDLIGCQPDSQGSCILYETTSISDPAWCGSPRTIYVSREDSGLDRIQFADGGGASVASVGRATHLACASAGDTDDLVLVGRDGTSGAVGAAYMINSVPKIAEWTSIPGDAFRDGFALRDRATAAVITDAGLLLETRVTSGSGGWITSTSQALQTPDVTKIGGIKESTALLAEIGGGSVFVGFRGDPLMPDGGFERSSVTLQLDEHTVPDAGIAAWRSNTMVPGEPDDYVVVRADAANGYSFDVISLDSSETVTVHSVLDYAARGKILAFAPLPDVSMASVPTIVAAVEEPSLTTLREFHPNGDPDGIRIADLPRNAPVRIQIAGTYILVGVRAPANRYVIARMAAAILPK